MEVEGAGWLLRCMLSLRIMKVSLDVEVQLLLVLASSSK